MWTLNRRFSEKGYKLIAGVDEAGRGPLAGPVVASAVILPSDMALNGIDDSKKLTSKKRDKAFDYIMATALAVGVGQSEPKEIDEKNILQASLLAMRRALEALPSGFDVVFVDGNQRIPDIIQPQLTVVGGDASCAEIAAASIIAKVTRDRIMTKLHEQYPVYGFDKHKGYPCAAHLEALKIYGATPVHRFSYAPVASAAGQASVPKKRTLGSQGELYAANYLEKKGWRILHRNWRCDIGEVDIIAECGSELVFVEVKTRRNDLYGSPAEAVDDNKQQQLYRLAEAYLSQSALFDRNYRFDVIAITASRLGMDVLHNENAF